MRRGPLTPVFDQDKRSGSIVVGATPPTTPPPTLTELGSVSDATLLNFAFCVDIVGNYAYVGADDHLTVVDVSDPNSPTIVGNLNDATNLGFPTRVQVVGNYAYTVNPNQDRFTVVDISTPTAPTLAGTVANATTLEDIWGMTVVGNYAYVVGTRSINPRFATIDISTPTTPTVAGSIVLSNAPPSTVGVGLVGTDAYVSNSAGVQEVDVSTPATPVEVGSPVGGTQDHLHVGADFVLAVDSSNTAQSFDFAEVTPLQDTLVDATNLAQARQVEVDGNYAFVICGSGGRVTVLDVSDITNLGVFTSLAGLVGSNGEGISVSGSLIGIVDSNNNRLQLYDFS